MAGEVGAKPTGGVWGANVWKGERWAMFSVAPEIAELIAGFRRATANYSTRQNRDLYGEHANDKICRFQTPNMVYTWASESVFETSAEHPMQVRGSTSTPSPSAAFCPCRMISAKPIHTRDILLPLLSHHLSTVAAVPVSLNLNDSTTTTLGASYLDKRLLTIAIRIPCARRTQWNDPPS